MKMKYRATLTIDFTNQNSNDHQKLLAALLQRGWVYQETSALTVDTNELWRIWAAFDLIPRQAAAAGTLSALTLHVQGAADFSGTTYAGAKNHPNAVTDIQKRPFPEY
jgi:hypothetical protein